MELISQEHELWCKQWVDNDSQYVDAYKHEFRKFIPDIKETNENSSVQCEFCGSKDIVRHHEHCVVACASCGQSVERGGEYRDVGVGGSKRGKSNKYKRILHFMVTLRCIQGNENVNISKEEEKIIKMAISKTYPKKLPSTLSTKDVRGALQKYRKKGLPKFYDHCQAILCRLYGHDHPVITKEETRYLIHMFMMIQAPFEKHKGSRKNFLSYRLVTLRLGELLNITAITNNTSSLKCDDKRSKQNSIWKLICEELGWATGLEKIQ